MIFLLRKPANYNDGNRGNRCILNPDRKSTSMRCILGEMEISFLGRLHVSAMNHDHGNESRGNFGHTDPLAAIFLPTKNEL